MNRCRRCNRELSDPNANYGWRCAAILGVSEALSQMSEDVFKKFTNGVTKAKQLFENSNLKLTNEQWKKTNSAYAKMSLWDGIDDEKVKEARLDSYSVFSSSKNKNKSFIDELKEYKKYIDNYGLLVGTGRKLAKNETLDEVTNAILKVHDHFTKNTLSTKLMSPVGSNLYDSAHNVLAGINYIYNKNVDLSSYKGGFINDQNDGAVSELKFGVDKMKDNGCEVIAAYNALLMLDNPKDIRDIAYYFENDGQALAGKFGTNPYAAKRFFTKNGYTVKTLEGEDITDKNIPDADAYILSVWNSPDVTEALHTVAMRKTKDGFELFNYGKTDNNNPTPAKYLWLKMELKNEIPLILHCISKE